MVQHNVNKNGTALCHGVWNLETHTNHICFVDNVEFTYNNESKFNNIMMAIVWAGALE